MTGETLTQSSIFMLGWLYAGPGLLGECHGATLDELLALGLAELGPVPLGKDEHFRSVELTEEGRTRAREIERAKFKR